MNNSGNDADVAGRSNPRLRTQLRQALGAIAVLIGFTAVPFVTGIGATLLDLQRVVSALSFGYTDSPGVENAAWLILIIAILALLATLFAISRAPARSVAPPRTIETSVAIGGLLVIVILVAIWIVLFIEFEPEASDVVSSPSSWVILVGGLLMLAGRGPTGSLGQVRMREHERSDRDVGHPAVTSETGESTQSQREIEAGAVLAVASAAILALLLIIGAFAERDFVPIVLVLSPFAMLAATNPTLARQAAAHLPPSIRWPLGVDLELGRSAAVGICGVIAIAGLGVLWTALMWLAIIALSVFAYAQADFERLASQFAGEVTITAGDREYRIRTVGAARALTLVIAVIASIVFLVRDDIWWLS